MAVGSLVALHTTSEISGSSRVALAGAAALFGFLGLLEDVWGIPALWRLGAQVAIALAMLPALLDGLSSPWYWWLLSTAGVALWLVGFVNVFNFMDGINGISSAQMLVAGTSFALMGTARDLPDIAIVGAIVAASALGFAPFNFPHARMFLGDVGSYFLGAWLAVIVVVGLRGGLPPEAALAPLALYLADTGATLVRRVLRGATWHEAHREHVYQQLVDRGWSHMSTTSLVGALLVASSGLGGVSLTMAPTGIRVGADTLLLALLAGYLALPRALAHRSGSVLLPDHRRRSEGSHEPRRRASPPRPDASMAGRN